MAKIKEKVLKKYVLGIAKGRLKVRETLLTVRQLIGMKKSKFAVDKLNSAAIMKVDS